MRKVTREDDAAMATMVALSTRALHRTLSTQAQAVGSCGHFCGSGVWTVLVACG